MGLKEKDVPLSDPGRKQNTGTVYVEWAREWLEILAATGKTKNYILCLPFVLLQWWQNLEMTSAWSSQWYLQPSPLLWMMHQPNKEWKRGNANSRSAPHQCPCLEAMARQGWLKSLMGEPRSFSRTWVGTGGDRLAQMDTGFPSTSHLGTKPSGWSPLICHCEGKGAQLLLLCRSSQPDLADSKLFPAGPCGCNCSILPSYR